MATADEPAKTLRQEIDEDFAAKLAAGKSALLEEAKTAMASKIRSSWKGPDVPIHIKLSNAALEKHFKAGACPEPHLLNIFICEELNNDPYFAEFMFKPHHEDTEGTQAYGYLTVVITSI